MHTLFDLLALTLKVDDSTCCCTRSIVLIWQNSWTASRPGRTTVCQRANFLQTILEGDSPPNCLCLLSAVGFVHPCGIKHMGIKPPNIVLRWTTAPEIPNVCGINFLPVTSVYHTASKWITRVKRTSMLESLPDTPRRGSCSTISWERS
jgi:serine/threonine protein kinase